MKNSSSGFAYFSLAYNHFFGLLLPNFSTLKLYSALYHQNHWLLSMSRKIQQLSLHVYSGFPSPPRSSTCSWSLPSKPSMSSSPLSPLCLTLTSSVLLHSTVQAARINDYLLCLATLDDYNPPSCTPIQCPPLSLSSKRTSVKSLAQPLSLYPLINNVCVIKREKRGL